MWLPHSNLSLSFVAVMVSLQTTPALAKYSAIKVVSLGALSASSHFGLGIIILRYYKQMLIHQYQKMLSTASNQPNQVSLNWR